MKLPWLHPSGLDARAENTEGSDFDIIISASPCTTPLSIKETP